MTEGIFENIEDYDYENYSDFLELSALIFLLLSEISASYISFVLFID